MTDETLPGLGHDELGAPPIRYVGTAELDRKLAELYAAHPGLQAAADAFSAPDECSCCVESSLGERFGYAVASEVGSLRFLLGLDR